MQEVWYKNQGRIMLDCTFIKSNIFKHFSDQYSYAGATACTDCPAGYSCASASVAPVLCALGEYSAAACKYTTFIIPPPMTKGAFKLTSPSLWGWHIVFILSVHPSLCPSVTIAGTQIAIFYIGMCAWLLPNGDLHVITAVWSDHLKKELL